VSNVRIRVFDELIVVTEAAVVYKNILHNRIVRICSAHSAVEPSCSILVVLGHDILQRRTVLGWGLHRAVSGQRYTLHIPQILPSFIKVEDLCFFNAGPL
jgi:hypothetical protein